MNEQSKVNRPGASDRLHFTLFRFTLHLIFPSSVSSLPYLHHVLLPLLPPAPAKDRVPRRVHHDHPTNSQRPTHRVSPLPCHSSFLTHPRLKEDAPTDIHYTWQRIPAVSPQHTTQAVKLTTYNPPVNTYKPLSIPLPAAAKQGETWRLGLFSPPAREVQGSLDALERYVCGVWSEGISVTAPRRRSFADNAAGKQTRVFREWRMPRGGGGGGASPEPMRVLRIVEQTSFDLDKVRPPPLSCKTQLIPRYRKSGTRVWHSPHGCTSTSRTPLPTR
jgi:hypothetical protein